ncbi:hypothetical protein O181_059199 [Austropuccinia psidii MF-1]|uniref:Uncharacterized protein n=1 Tax=Austropuccinia psidii MF-1 TaxID=1389203 RepID=A0A9Q3EDY4_9BASI|nr:hypothetical protein [Austropuccinia psidii MF-1]
MNSYLHIKSFLGQERTIKLLGGWRPLVKEPKYFIHRQEGVGNDPSFGEERTIGIQQLQGSSRSVQRQSQRTSEGEVRSQEASRKGKRQSQLSQTLPTRVQDSQIGTFSRGHCIQYGQKSYGIHSQRAGKDEKDFSMQTIDEIRSIKASIDIEIGKFDEKLNKRTSDINDLKTNDRIPAEWNKFTASRIELISSLCDRIESKVQVQDYGMEDLSITQINDQLKIPTNHVSEMVSNTNLFATHFARNDSERKKLKDEMITHVEQIYKNYEPNSHIPKNYTPFTEEKPSVKGSLTPFLGENATSAKDIHILEQWPTFSGQGKLNQIEFIRKIDMLRKDFHINDEIIAGKLHSVFNGSAKKWY